MEDDLIYRAQQGDHVAFQQLVERYADVALRTAQVLLHERTIAEDAMQEAWVDVWRGLPCFQLNRPFRPWLLTLVANRCKMITRRHALHTVPFSVGISDAYIHTDTVEEQMLRLEVDAELHIALTTLTEEQQHILQLRFFADLDLSEIALVTDIPLGTVKSRLHRTLKTLRTQLQRKQQVVLYQEKKT